jgi:hypothetical protein
VCICKLEFACPPTEFICNEEYLSNRFLTPIPRRNHYWGTTTGKEPLLGNHYWEPPLGRNHYWEPLLEKRFRMEAAVSIYVCAYILFVDVHHVYMHAFLRLADPNNTSIAMTVRSYLAERVAQGCLGLVDTFQLKFLCTSKELIKIFFFHLSVYFREPDRTELHCSVRFKVY